MTSSRSRTPRFPQLSGYRLRAEAASTPEAGACLPADHLPSARSSHAPPTPVRDDTPCPSLASDVSSQRSGSIDPANTEYEQRSTIKFHSDPQLHIVDRVIVWSRWLEHEPNPVFESDEIQRGRHLRGLEGTVALWSENIQSPSKPERFDPPSGEEAQGLEPFDSDVGRRQVGRVQASSKTGNTPGTRSQKAALSKDITDPTGSDEGELRLGFGIYNARNGIWCFKCYWFKRHPDLHRECTLADFEGERSVRTVSP